MRMQSTYVGSNKHNKRKEKQSYLPASMARLPPSNRQPQQQQQQQGARMIGSVRVGRSLKSAELLRSGLGVRAMMFCLKGT